MNVRVRLFWALFLAVVAALMSYSYLGSLRNEADIVVAAQDIPAHTIITADMVKVVRVHASARGTLAPDAAARPEDVVGAMTVQDLPKDEVVRNNPRWLTREEGAVQAANADRLSYFLPKETRAISVVVDSQGLVAGRVKKGDMVDVIFTSRDDSTGGVYSALILQHVQVLGVDGAGGQYQVTFLVTPAQALDLTLAKRRGTLDLALTPPAPERVNLPPASPLKFPMMGQGTP